MKTAHLGGFPSYRPSILEADKAYFLSLLTSASTLSAISSVIPASLACGSAIMDLRVISLAISSMEFFEAPGA